MLHAELRGKFDPNSPDIERREDVLTSTTFGTLMIGDASDLLFDWLTAARHLGQMRGCSISWLDEDRRAIATVRRSILDRERFEESAGNDAKGSGALR